MGDAPLDDSGNPSHTQHYTARQYAICDNTTNISLPIFFEHLLPTYQAHFTYNTKFACPPSTR